MFLPPETPNRISLLDLLRRAATGCEETSQLTALSLLDTEEKDNDSSTVGPQKEFNGAIVDYELSTIIACSRRLEDAVAV